MSQIANAATKQEVEHRYSRRSIKRIADSIAVQDDANEAAQALRDDATTLKQAPVIWNLSASYNLMLACTTGCFSVVVILLIVAITMSAQLRGVGLYSLLGSVALASSLGVWAALRARSIRREDARHATMLDAKLIEDAGRFVKTFGPAPWDNAGVLLAVAGGIDGALAGLIIATGLAQSMPIAVVLVSAGMFAVTFVAALRWIAARFEARWACIRAKMWVRNVERIDLTRFPEKVEEVEYLQDRLGPLCDNLFSKPRFAEYAVAAGLLLLIPALFVLLIAYRVWWANSDGATDIAMVIGVSILCAILATLGAVLGAMGHIMRDEARTMTAINRRFPTASTFEDWHARHERSCERWANDIARHINIALRKAEQDGDARWTQRGLALPRPFEVHAMPTNHEQSPVMSLEPEVSS